MKGVSKPTPDAGENDTQNAKELKYWVKALGTSEEILLLAIEKVGNSAATVRKELERRALSEAPPSQTIFRSVRTASRSRRTMARPSPTPATR